LKDLQFNEERTTQAAAYLLKLRGGAMSYMKLVKLLYIADRLALLNSGRPITCDKFVAMDHGPVPSRTLDLVKRKNRFGARVWHRFISRPEAPEGQSTKDEVHLVADPGVGQLSDNQVRILYSVFAEWGDKDRWTVQQYTHDLPEYVANAPEPKRTRPISIRDILVAEGVPENEVAEIEGALEAERVMQNLTR
jgi:hypothetical protein